MPRQHTILPAAPVLAKLAPKNRYLIAVSGGRDSVALLHWLVQTGFDRLVVCHLDHGLRGRSSTADARFVERLSQQYDLVYEGETADVRAMSRKKKLSVEAAGRAARYSFFAKIARRRRCQTIFLAHHADDLVETFLINLFRGAGTTGLSAMREMVTRQIGGVKLTIVRPWLGVSRAEINQYIRSYRLPFREDASNENLDPLRNRIRRRIIPYLERNVRPNIRHNIRRTAAILAEEEAFFDRLLPKEFAGSRRLSVADLRHMPVALQRRLLHRWIKSEGVSDVGFELIEQVRSIAETANGAAKTNLPRDRHVRRQAGHIFIE